jgi:hypothetical protein
VARWNADLADKPMRMPFRAMEAGTQRSSIPQLGSACCNGGGGFAVFVVGGFCLSFNLGRRLQVARA